MTAVHCIDSELEDRASTETRVVADGGTIEEIEANSNLYYQQYCVTVCTYYSEDNSVVCAPITVRITVLCVCEDNSVVCV